MNIIQIAFEYARKCHEDTNHVYDNKHPYIFHLQMVYGVAAEFINIIPEEIQDNVLAACYTHDLIEDCRQTYNDVLKATNKEVAELTYAVTNEKGKNRKERANNKYYSEMANVPGARFIKLCDRIANVRYSLTTGGNMLEKYRKENAEFCSYVYSDKYALMIATLEKILKP